MSKNDTLIEIHGDVWITAKELAENARRGPVFTELLRGWHGGEFSLDDCDVVLALCGELKVETMLEPLLRKPMTALVPDGTGYPTKEQVAEALTWLPENIELKKGRDYSIDVEGLRPEVATAAKLLLEWVQGWTPDKAVPRVFAHSYLRLRNEVHAWWLENWGHRDNDAKKLRSVAWKADEELIKKIAETPTRHWSDE